KPSYLPVNVVSALANLSQSVHVRTPPVQSPNPTIYVTSASTPPTGAGPTPIENLRNAKILNYNVPTGSGATYAGRSHRTLSGNSPTNNAAIFDSLCTDATTENWPNVYLACQTGGWNLVGAATYWSTLNETSYS